MYIKVRDADNQIVQRESYVIPADTGFTIYQCYNAGATHFDGTSFIYEPSDAEALTRGEAWQAAKMALCAQEWSTATMVDSERLVCMGARELMTAALWTELTGIY